MAHFNSINGARIAVPVCFCPAYAALPGVKQKKAKIVAFDMKELQDDPETCLDELHKWLGMVHTNARAAPVILVGTHKDQVQPCNRRVLEDLSTHIVDRFGGHDIFPSIVMYGGNDHELAASLTFFPVDNTKSDGTTCDSVLQDLRSAVQSAIKDENNVFSTRRIPNAWMELYE